MGEPSLRSATTDGSQPRRAIGLVVSVAGRVAAACGVALVLNAAGLWLVGAPLAADCRASGGTSCLLAALLAIVLLAGVPAVYAVVSARAAALGAVTEAALRSAAGSGWLLDALARLLVSRLAAPAGLAARLDLGLEAYPRALRGALRLFLLASGLGKLSRSAPYLKAASDAADPTAAVADLLARDLRDAAEQRRAGFPWWLVAVNVAALAAARAAIR